MQHKASFLIQRNAASFYPFAYFLAYPDSDYLDADPD